MLDWSVGSWYTESNAVAAGSELGSWKSLGEEVGNLFLSRDVVEDDFLGFDLLADEVHLDVDVLGPSMLDGVLPELDAALVVFVERSRFFLRMVEVGK